MNMVMWLVLPISSQVFAPHLHLPGYVRLQNYSKTRAFIRRCDVALGDRINSLGGYFSGDRINSVPAIRTVTGRIVTAYRKTTDQSVSPVRYVKYLKQ